MIICCFLNAIFEKEIETKSVNNNCRTHVKEKIEMKKMQHNCLSGLMTDYIKLTKAHLKRHFLSQSQLYLSRAVK